MYAATPDVLPPDAATTRCPTGSAWRAGWSRRTTRSPRASTVNRAWEQFFGRGLVETSEDFGTQGAPPSHPELLDWLATEFVAAGLEHEGAASADRHVGDVPAVVGGHAGARSRRIRTTGCWRAGRASAWRPRWCATSRWPPAGCSSPTIGGPSVFPPQPDGIWDNPYSDDAWKTSKGEDRHRRGLYTFIRRTSPYPSFMTFDATSREVCTVRRVRTNTPLQALTGLNDEAFFEAARALARRDRHARRRRRARQRASRWLPARARAGSPTSARSTPSSRRTRRQLAHYRSRPAEAAKVMKATAPLAGDVAELAAWTLVANALLNLDETLTK